MLIASSYQGSLRQAMIWRVSRAGRQYMSLRCGVEHSVLTSFFIFAAFTLFTEARNNFVNTHAAYSQPEE